MREWVWSKKGELYKAELNKLPSPSNFCLCLILSQVLMLFLKKEKRDSRWSKHLIIKSLFYRLSLTLRHAGSQFLELGIESVPLKWEQESTARKVYRTSTILVPISAFSGEAGNLCQTLPEGQPGHDISSDTCLLIPLRSVPTASPELQICRSSCSRSWFPGLPVCLEHARLSLSVSH